MNSSLLFIIGSFGTGGTERVVSLLANAYINKNVRVYLLSTSHHDQATSFPYELDSKIKLLTLTDIGLSTKSSLTNPRVTQRILKYCRAQKISLVVCMYEEIGLLLSAFPSFLKPKVITCIRNNPLIKRSNLFTRILRLLNAGSMHYIFQNKLQSEQYRKLARNLRHYKIISNPVDPNILALATDSTYSDHRDILTIVAIATKFHQKGVDISVDAYMSARLPMKSRLYLIGCDNPTALNEYLSHASVLSKTLPPNKAVVPIGRTHQIYSLLNQADLLLFPSRYEGMPNLLLESFFFDLPTITSFEISSLVPSDMRVNHLVYNTDEHNNASSSVASLIELFSSSRNNQPKLTRGARSRLFKEYNRKTMEEWFSALNDEP